MAVIRWLKKMIQYLERGTARIFSPSEDDYPKTGVQPFEGEPYNENKESIY